MSETTLPPAAVERQSEEPLWEIEDVVAYLNVSDSTVRRLVAREEIPFKRVGGQLRFVPALIRGWVRTDAADETAA